MQPNESQPQLIQAVPMRANLLGGISDMTLHRWLNNPALGFPRPIKINNLRYWRVADVHQWLINKEAAA